MMSDNSRTNELLGYPADARLLILNADDFGMCQAENEATIQAIKQGLASSCTLMMPCPWGLHGLQLLRENPDIPFGVHLTAVCEYQYYRWGPLTSREKVPSLLDKAGFFYSEERIPEFLGQANLAELETEFRAQIEAVVAGGLKPTHLDSHCGIHTRREDIFDMTVHLAHEYGLAVRATIKPLTTKLQQQGYPTLDHELLDSYDIDPRTKPAHYYNLLRELPPGLSEWALHPAIGNAELKAISSSWPVRQTDFDFLMAQEARDIIQAEGIVILSYEALQKVWQQ
jgi:predicted glycoside hydrolase/deacetylase ChbG (UPF0249 family)